jgi:hypothetical protein
MDTGIAYSASREDLYSPGKNARFFPAGTPSSDAALCAEMSRLAYCRNDPSRVFDRARIVAVLNLIGFTICDFFESDGNHCFFAKNSIGLGVIAFRGTDADDPTDLGEDADVVLKPWTRGRVHQGFANGLEKIRPGLEETLQPFVGKVLFTGHSLGAAMATLFAGVKKPDFLYTFGSPRAGDFDFVNSLATLPNRRYVDCCDLVTRVPPELLGYVHLGNPHYIDSGRHIIDNPDPESVAADQTRARRQYLVDYTWKKGTVALRDLADHAPINYVLPLSADQ